MAQDKKSFVLYSDYQELFNELNDQDAGKLIKHIFSYVNDENPVSEHQIVNISFIPIKLQLKRDLKKYESKKEQWSEAGKKSAESRKLAKENERTLTDVNSVVTVSTVNVTDNVNVTVNDTVIKINNIDERKLKFASTLEPFLKKYGRELLKDFYKYWTEPNKSNSKFKQEMEKTWSLERRLETWSNNNFGNKKQNQDQQSIQSQIPLGTR